MKKLELNFSKRNIAIFGLLVVILLAILFFVRSTYGYYQENLELKNSLEMSVATLSYGLNDEYKVVVPSKGEVRVPIAVMGFNSQETKYQMYYRSSDDLSQVIIGYASYSSNLPSGDLGVGESKQVSLILKNNGNSEVTVFVGVKGGYQNNSIEDILLGNGEIRITNRVESEEVTKDMAAPEDILTGKKAWVNGNQITGTMVNRGTVNQTLKAGESYAIPEGYHDGKGVISSESLASQTQANATASQILSGQTAWVNGSKITGTMANRGNLNWKPSNGTTYTVPAGYYSGGTLDSTSAYNNGYNSGYNAGREEGLKGSGLEFTMSIYVVPNRTSGAHSYPVQNLDISNYTTLKVTGTVGGIYGYVEFMADGKAISPQLINNNNINLSYDISSYSTFTIHVFGYYTQVLDADLNIEIQ